MTERTYRVDAIVDRRVVVRMHITAPESDATLDAVIAAADVHFDTLRGLAKRSIRVTRTGRHFEPRIGKEGAYAPEQRNSAASKAGYHANASASVVPSRVAPTTPGQSLCAKLTRSREVPAVETTQARPPLAQAARSPARLYPWLRRVPTPCARPGCGGPLSSTDCIAYDSATKRGYHAACAPGGTR